MTILNTYLFKRFMFGFILSLVVLLSIETFLSFTGELEDLNAGNYTFLVLLKYIILNIPKSIHDLFPYALLIGAMLSLGAMAADMEFVAIQSAGISTFKTIQTILIQTLIVSSIFYIISDFFVSDFTKKAEQKKNIAISKKAVHHANGVWFKDQNKFINIDEVYSNKFLKNISIYIYDYDLKIKSFQHIDEAEFEDGAWTLLGVKETFFNVKPITKKYYQKKIDSDFIDTKLLNIAVHKPSNLSLPDIMNNIEYLEKNNLDVTTQTRVFWEKLFKPFSTAIMLFLAMPFLFGKYRTNTQGKRIVVGLLIGIIFFVATTMLPNLGSVLGLNSFFNVLLPHVLFIMLGLKLYSRQLESGLQ